MRMDDSATQSDFLLCERDPVPFEVIGGDDATGIVLVCDHAGRHLPEALRSRAPTGEQMLTHAAYDIGAEQVARNVARLTGVPLIVQRYSRLVIDPNRPRRSPQLAPPVSDGIEVPFNRDLTEQDLDYRWTHIHQPYHRQISAKLDAAESKPSALVAIHSFTRQLRDSEPRPWHIDLMTRYPSPYFDMVRSQAEQWFPHLNVGVNQVFPIGDNSDYTIPTHAEPRGIPHFSIEIRNDLLAEQAAVNCFAHAVACIICRWLAKEFESVQHAQRAEQLAASAPALGRNIG